MLTDERNSRFWSILHLMCLSNVCKRLQPFSSRWGWPHPTPFTFVSLQSQNGHRPFISLSLSSLCTVYKGLLVLADGGGEVEIWWKMSVYFFQFSFCVPYTHENIDLLPRVADPHHFNVDPYLAFHFKAVPDQVPLQSDMIYDRLCVDPPGLHFEPSGLHCESPRLHFEPLKLLNLWLQCGFGSSFQK